MPVQPFTQVLRIVKSGALHACSRFSNGQGASSTGRGGGATASSALTQAYRQPSKIPRLASASSIGQQSTLPARQGSRGVTHTAHCIEQHEQHAHCIEQHEQHIASNNTNDTHIALNNTNNTHIALNNTNNTLRIALNNTNNSYIKQHEQHAHCIEQHEQPPTSNNTNNTHIALNNTNNHLHEPWNAYA